MNFITQPLARLVDSLQWFMRAQEKRMLHVTTTSSLRLGALEEIAAAEHHGDNRCPFIVLEAPAKPGDDGWTTRALELRDDVEELRALVGRDDGIELPPMPDEAEAETPLLRFGRELCAALGCLRDPFEGLVVVLSPIEMGDAKRWVEDVKALVAQPGLAKVRWVIVDLEEPLCEPVALSLGSLAESVDARIDEAAAGAEMDGLSKAMATAPEGATGARLAGLAGPREVPPPRRGKPPPPTREEMSAIAKKAGLPEALADAALMRRLRQRITDGARAMRRGDVVEAAQRQREARDLCIDAGLVRHAIIMEMVLGGYVLQGGAPKLAVTAFQQAKERAESAGFADLTLQAELALAAALLMQRRPDEAAVAYAEAGQLGATAGLAALAIEAYRMAGHLLATQGKIELAGKAWRRALDVAESASPLDRTASSAPETARALAALCRKHGLVQSAEALTAQAAVMETMVA